ncbi:MAG TPA: VOC family protein [Candidatus Limnocylindria bacterium]|jgi:predicted enzyme related to lactoylglutathione lyase|nr:VOC family protein [Candidatus Limnocylindria bacterium]
MERATGIGGVFFRASDPATLAEWYRQALGIDTFAGESGTPWFQEAGATAFSAFPRDTDYLGRPEQQVMLNFRVTDLDAMLQQVRAAGGTVDDDLQEYEGLGRFGWATDPEGNRFELWQPAPEDGG